MYDEHLDSFLLKLDCDAAKEDGDYENEQGCCDDEFHLMLHFVVRFT